MSEFLDLDLDISQEDLRDIDLLEASIFQEIERRCASDSEDLQSDNEIICPPKKRLRRIVQSESESDTDSVADFVATQIQELPDHTYQKWLHPKGHQPSVIVFTEQTG